MMNKESIPEILECSQADKDFAEEIFERASSEEGQKRAQELIARYKAEHNYEPLEQNEQDILKALNVDYFAARFFGQSGEWLRQRINHEMVDGKPADFTEEERALLKDAVETIVEDFEDLADSM